MRIGRLSERLRARICKSKNVSFSHHDPFHKREQTNDSLQPVPITIIHCIIVLWQGALA